MFVNPKRQRIIKGLCGENKSKGKYRWKLNAFILRLVVSPFDRKSDVECSTRHDSIWRGISSTYCVRNDFPKLSVVMGVAQPRFSGNFLLCWLLLSLAFLPLWPSGVTGSIRISLPFP
jgi:hypothetical protein